MHYLKPELLLNLIGSLSLLPTDRLPVGIFQASTEVEEPLSSPDKLERQLIFS